MNQRFDLHLVVHVAVEKDQLGDLCGEFERRESFADSPNHPSLFLPYDVVDALRDAAGDGGFGTERAIGDGRHRKVERLEEGRNAVELLSDDLLVTPSSHSHHRHAEEVVRQRSHVLPVHFAFIGGGGVARTELLEDSLA